MNEYSSNPDGQSIIDDIKKLIDATLNGRYGIDFTKPRPHSRLEVLWELRSEGVLKAIKKNKEDYETYTDLLCGCATLVDEPDYESKRCFYFEYKGKPYVLKRLGHQGRYWIEVNTRYLYFNKTLLSQYYKTIQEANKDYRGMVKDIKNNNADYIYVHIEPNDFLKRKTLLERTILCGLKHLKTN